MKFCRACNPQYYLCNDTYSVISTVSLANLLYHSSKVAPVPEIWEIKTLIKHSNLMNVQFNANHLNEKSGPCRVCRVLYG